MTSHDVTRVMTSSPCLIDVTPGLMTSRDVTRMMTSLGHIMMSLGHFPMPLGKKIEVEVEAMKFCHSDIF